MFSSSSSAVRRWTLPAVVLCGLAGANGAGAIVLPPVDGDLGWQRWLGTQVLHGGLPHALGGESFAAPGARWVTQEWLFSALLALASAHGVAWLVALGVAACSIAALLCVAARCARGGASPAATAFVLVFTDVAMSQSFGVRVQVVGWAMLAGLLLALELPPRLRWTAIAIAAAWANVHASAVLAPIVCAAAACGSLAARDVRGALADAAIAAGAALAVCATPFGITLPAYAVDLAHSPIRHWIREWRTPSFADPALAFGALPLLALALAEIRRAPRRAAALALPFAYLMLVAVRNVPLAAIAVAPLAARSLSALLPSLAALRPVRGRVAAAACAATFACAAAAAAVGARTVPDARPLSAIATARALHAHRLFCEDFGWCGDATGRVPVFLDGRADPFPPAVWNAYDTVLHVRPGWRAIVRRYGVDAMIVRRDGALDRAARRAGWRVTEDAPIRLLVRPAGG
jgi:hypothetical protein